VIVRLVDMCNRTFASVDPYWLTNKWEWITNTFAERLGCDPDDIHSDEDEECLDWVTLNGVKVGRVEYEYGLTASQRRAAA
jgi:hypothetical protein